MKLSLLALQIILFQYPTPALVHNHDLAARNLSRRHRHRGQRQRRKEVSVSSSSSHLDSSMGSSDASSNIIEMLPVVHRRHPLFRETNVVSKKMAVPHLNLWKQCLPSAAKHCNKLNRKKNANANANNAFWNFLSPQSQKQKDDATVNVNADGNNNVPLRDVHVQFTDPSIGAQQLLEQCGVITTSSSSATTAQSDDGSSSSSAPLPLPEIVMAENIETAQHLTDILAYFQSVAAPAATGDEKNIKNVNCIARVVSTVGSVGTKCPRWHADHVPVRLVMSILGPGCEYIPENVSSKDNDNDLPVPPSRKIVDRSALNNLDEDDTMKANDIIVPPELLIAEGGESTSTIIKHAEEGEAVLLMGRGWEDARLDDTLLREENEESIAQNSNSIIASEDEVLAAVHRSPTLTPGQERILLTVDLVDWD